MCYGSEGRMEPARHGHCGCSCSCPATMTVEEEIQLLEDHKKFMQDRIGIIEKKIAILKSAK